MRNEMTREIFELKFCERMNRINEIKSCSVCKKGEMEIMPLLCHEKFFVMKKIVFTEQSFILKKKHKDVINAIYIPLQCNHCGFLTKHIFGSMID